MRAQFSESLPYNSYFRTPIAKSRYWDVWTADSQYLLTVHHYSTYTKLHLLDLDLTSTGVIKPLKSFFARHEPPGLFRSDNSTQFSLSAFQIFSITYKFQHLTSSPCSPHCNGDVKRMIRILKSSPKKILNHYLVLLSYQNMLGPPRYGPIQLLMGWHLRSTVSVSGLQETSPVARFVRVSSILMSYWVEKDDNLLWQTQTEAVQYQAWKWTRTSLNKWFPAPGNQAQSLSTATSESQALDWSEDQLVQEAP